MQKKRILVNVKLMSKKGFTLIELLITITIIVILAAIGIISYQSVLKSGRDSKRQADLRSIQSALEQYYNDQGYFPEVVTFGSALTYGAKTYMTKIPQDPINNATYKYTWSPYACASLKCTSYCLYANLEIDISQPNPDPVKCTLSGNFIVVPP